MSLKGRFAGSAAGLFRAAALLSALCVSLLLSGCSRELRGAARSSRAAEFSWTAYSGTTISFLANLHPWVDLVKPRLAEFERLSGIRVDTAVYPEDQFRTKLTIELMSGTSDVDVFMIMPGQDLARYTDSGWIAPLEGYLSSKSLLWPSYDAADLFSAARRAGMRGDVSYTIPIQLETSLLAYNKKIFAEYRLAVPRTMEELRDTARKVHELSGGSLYGITLRGKGGAATSQWVDFLHSYGGSWLTSEGRAAVASGESEAATRLYGELLGRYGPKSGPSNAWYESVSIFMQGKAAMIYDANVFKAEYENPEISRVAGSVGYAMIPAGPAGAVPHISTWSLGISSASPRKEAAWLFIQWATSKELELAALLAGIPSARSSVWNSPSFKERDATPEWTKATLESYKIASPDWNPAVVPVAECRDAVGTAIVTSILGGDVGQALRTAGHDMDSAIAERSRSGPR